MADHTGASKRGEAQINAVREPPVPKTGVCPQPTPEACDSCGEFTQHFWPSANDGLHPPDPRHHPQCTAYISGEAAHTFQCRDGAGHGHSWISARSLGQQATVGTHAKQRTQTGSHTPPPKPHVPRMPRPRCKRRGRHSTNAAAHVVCEPHHAQRRTESRRRQPP